MSEQAEVPPETTAMARTALSAGEALASKESYKTEAWWRWSAMIDGGAVAKTETPATCIAKAAFGEIYGWTPILSVARVYLVEGRPCLAAEAMVGLVRERMPKAQIYKVEHDAKHCKIKAKRDPSDEEWHVVEMHIDDFKHLANKTNWKNYPKAMLWARAASALTRELFSDVTLGAHTMEELEDAPRVRQMSGNEGPVVVEEPALDAEPVVDVEYEPAPDPLPDCELCGGENGVHTDLLCPNRGSDEEVDDGADHLDGDGPSPDAALLAAAVSGKLPADTTKKARRSKAQKESE